MSSISIGSLTTLNLRSLNVPIGWLRGACTSSRRSPAAQKSVLVASIVSLVEVPDSLYSAERHMSSLSSIKDHRYRIRSSEAPSNYPLR